MPARPICDSALKILNTLLGFPTLTHHWTSGCLRNDARAGDLVTLNCAPPSAWCVSWLIEVEPLLDDEGRQYDMRFLLESIFTGKQQWWVNVGLNIYDREQVSSHPEWREEN